MAVKTFDNGAAAVTASGNSPFAPDLENPQIHNHVPPNNISVLVVTSAVSGTSPSLTVEVQWSNDGTTFASAATPDTFTAITANGSVVKSFQVKGRFARLKYTVTGTTPSFTVNATAYTA